MPNREFHVVVLSQYCKGCGLCVEVCQVEKLYIETYPNREGIQVAGVRPEVRCTGCLKCATICPDAAIEIRRLEASAVGTVRRSPRGAAR